MVERSVLPQSSGPIKIDHVRLPFDAMTRI